MTVSQGVRRAPALSVPLRTKYVPIVANPTARSMMSVSLAIALQANQLSASTVAAFVFTWLAGIFVADKYVHKYPYRYDYYLIASHLKATAVTALLLWTIALATPIDSAAAGVWRALGILAVFDLLLSLPRRRVAGRVPGDRSFIPQNANTTPVDAAKRPETPKPSIAETLSQLPDAVRAAIAVVFGQPAQQVTVATEDQVPSSPTDILAIITPLNDVRRINRLLLSCTEKLRPGGYIVCAYRPLDNEEYRGLQKIWVFFWHRACPKLPIVERLYFAITRGRNRRLSRAEAWGRLAFCGHKVIVEQDGPTAVVVARQESPVIVGRRPSYYPIVSLTKVGLDGEQLVTHKVRSMFPFSEFIQKQVFESNGLAAAGKISNDFRVTSYGRYLRRYWLDELPQIYDWLRGDIKLVGMRATSHHFLGLYPPEFIDLYVRVKPGLIPPLFNEKTAGFAEIVEVEQRYLQAYLQNPVQTDLLNLYRTLRDIALRGVRGN